MKLHILPSVFGKNRERSESVTSSWQWNACAAAGKTLSSRYDAADAAPGGGMFKTVNSVYLDPLSEGAGTPESWFTNSASESADFSTESDDERIIITGVRSDRLFFDRSGTSSAITAPGNQENPKKQRPEKEEQKVKAGKKSGVLPPPPPFQKSVAVAMDSGDPYGDFKRSMEEMVASNGVESLQELLRWYLKMNEKENHGYIVRAFMDLLLGISSSCSPISANSADVVRTSYSSAVSCLSSPPASPLSSVEER